MAEFIFIRHGKPNYDAAAKLRFEGIARDFAPLSDEGIMQAEKAAKNITDCNADLILSSPFTRALQTAAEISRVTGVKIIVEPALHEWLPDITFQWKTASEAFAAHADFCMHQGIASGKEHSTWETTQMMDERLFNCLEKYLKYRKVVVVAHGEVLRRCTGIGAIACCQPISVVVDSKFPRRSWVER